MSELELEVTALSVSYGRVQALVDVDLEIRRGQIVSLLGSNGAGKSTLLNALTCVIPKASGNVRLHGRDVTRATPWQLVDRGLAHVPEGRQVFPHLTVDQHLRLAMKERKGGTRSFGQEDIYAMFPRLLERREALAGNLSGGEQQMLAVGRALVTQPRLLLLDEPSLGLSPKLAQTVITAVASLRDDGVTVLLVEQNAALALDISDHVYVLGSGRVVAEGPAGPMRDSAEVRHAYLGEATPRTEAEIHPSRTT